MAKKLKIGDTINGYRITQVFGPGMMAISYAAQAPSGVRVFFKQYKSPAPSVVWYSAFVAYQKALAERVRASRAAHFAVRQVDAFEAVWGGRSYFQAFEFVESGADLQHLIDQDLDSRLPEGRATVRAPELWARHLTWAKVLISGVAALHHAKIVHADLKPANAYMMEDPTIGAGYQLKLIDMDFSVLADHRAPWHGHQAYVGTDNYRSPEHMTKGGVPTPASDIFTCGLMLYELLAGYHPYWQEDQAEYARLVQSYAASPPALLGRMPDPARNAEVSLALHKCLSPNAADRPSAVELQAILSGRVSRPTTSTEATVPSGSSKPVPQPPSAGSDLSKSGNPLRSDGLELRAGDGRVLRLKIRTTLGKAVLRSLGTEAEFWDDRQCVLERNDRGEWVLVPNSSAVNETLVNGNAVAAPQILREADVIAVGRQSKGIAKLPLTASGF
ncbi:MAG TPA: protein kinase [Ramlibacter sp.]|jgi:serine/threonine protein kinase